MPVYAFEALSATGDTRRGVIDADSAKSARGQLRQQGLVPLKVEPASASGRLGAGVPGRRTGRAVFGATALAIWTRQLAGLVSSGLPLERALTSLSDEAEKAPERELVAMLRAEVNGGAPFAKALAQHPREFSAIYVAVIGAGEQSGNLGLVLERLADDLEEQQALRAKLISAALYPAIVSLVAVVIVLFLV
nr:type II secretion system F family protein [Rhodoferax sp.]